MTEVAVIAMPCCGLKSTSLIAAPAIELTVSPVLAMSFSVIVVND